MENLRRPHKPKAPSLVAANGNIDVSRQQLELPPRSLAKRINAVHQPTTTYMHMHTSIHSYINTSMHPYFHTSIHQSVQTDMCAHDLSVSRSLRRSLSLSFSLFLSLSLSLARVCAPHPKALNEQTQACTRHRESCSLDPATLAKASVQLVLQLRHGSLGDVLAWQISPKQSTQFTDRLFDRLWEAHEWTKP